MKIIRIILLEFPKGINLSNFFKNEKLNLIKGPLEKEELRIKRRERREK